MISKSWKFTLFFFIGLAHGNKKALTSKCGNLVVLKEDNKIYGLEGVYDSNRAPSGWETKSESHLPIAQMEDSNTVRVHVPHNVIDDHFITHIWIEDGETGEVLGCKSFVHAEEPNTQFSIQPKVRFIVPFEHCSLHGVWKGATIDRFEGLIAANVKYKLEGAFNRTYHPDKFEKKLDSHIPSISVTSSEAWLGTIDILVSHPLPTPGTGDDHHVSMIWAKDQTGSIVAQKWFPPISEPRFSFLRVEAMKSVTVFAYCNLHGVWFSSLDLTHLDRVHHAEL